MNGNPQTLKPKKPKEPAAGHHRGFLGFDTDKAVARKGLGSFPQVAEPRHFEEPRLAVASASSPKRGHTQKAGWRVGIKIKPSRVLKGMGPVGFQKAGPAFFRGRPQKLRGANPGLRVSVPHGF